MLNEKLKCFSQIMTNIKALHHHLGSNLMSTCACRALVIMPLRWPVVALASTRGGKVRHTSVCVWGQHVQLQSLCVNEQRHAFSNYHSAPYSLSLSSSLNSCSPDNTPHRHPFPSKSLLSHHCGNWWCGRPGLGGRVGKTLQTRHEQMPETLDRRADHQGRTRRWVLMCGQVYACLICVWWGRGRRRERGG